MRQIAIFASGSGTNAENIIRYFTNNEFVKVSLVISNNPKAGVIKRAEALDVPCILFGKDAFKDGKAVLELLEDHAIDIVVLAGFMSFIPEALIEAYKDKIINIHPALLPKYGGKGMYGMHVHEAVKANKEVESGITIHYINEHYDEGRIIFQAKCPILPEDSPEDIAFKVHQLEYEYYPKVIEKLLDSNI